MTAVVGARRRFRLYVVLTLDESGAIVEKRVAPGVTSAQGIIVYRYTVGVLGSAGRYPSRREGSSTTGAAGRCAARRICRRAMASSGQRGRVAAVAPVGRSRAKTADGGRRRGRPQRGTTVPRPAPVKPDGLGFPRRRVERLPLVSRIATHYDSRVIVSFRHKGLERLYREVSKRGVQAGHVAKLLRILSVLDVALSQEDLAIPSLRTHPLKGELAGTGRSG